MKRILTALAVCALIVPAFALSVTGTATAGAIPCTVNGTGGDDILVGTNGPDTICGQGGNDKIRGKGGGDVIYGGGGNDIIAPGEGNDFVYGEAGTMDVVQFTGATGSIVANLDTGIANGQGTDA